MFGRGNIGFRLGTRAAAIGCLTFCVGALTSSAGAGVRATQLPTWDGFGSGQAPPKLSANTTYKVQALPLSFRISPTSGWRGAQWGTNNAGNTGYGRVVLGRSGVAIVIIASNVRGYGHSPEETITRLRPPKLPIALGSYHGVFYEPTTWLGPDSTPPNFPLPPSLARFRGYGFDADASWPTRLYPPQGPPQASFVPFTGGTSTAATPDQINLVQAARAFHFTPHTARFIALDVQGHTVVIAITTAASSVEKGDYVSLLNEIRPTLNSIRFST